MVEALYSRCRAQTFDDLGIGPCRLTTLQSVTRFRNQHLVLNIVELSKLCSQRIQSSFSVPGKLQNEHAYPEDAFLALTDYRMPVLKARVRARSHLLLATPTTHGTELLFAATALRACRDRHFGTLIRCCEAWNLVGQCFDSVSFCCANCNAKAHIVARLTRGSSAERKDAVYTLPWSKTEKQKGLCYMQAKSTCMLCEKNEANAPRCTRCSGSSLRRRR